MEPDRIYIDKSRSQEIRNIKDNGYLNFDNQKDVFLLALSLGSSSYRGGELSNGKDGFFLEKDLNEIDKAIIYSLVAPEIGNIENLTNNELVLKTAEGMANKGFTILLEEISDMSKEAFLLQNLKKTNELFDAANKNGLFKI